MRGLRSGVLALGIVAHLMAARSGQAQNGATRSLASGVFTDEQATRGDRTFREVCAACHATSEFARAGFFATWNGASLDGLFALIRTTMPQDEPGRLPAASYADVLAYLLRLNGFPAGPGELPWDTDGLRQIRVEPPAPTPGPSPAGSTLNGVYSTSQATAGRDRYALQCQGCHTVASHTGPGFVNVWNGRPLWDLFDYIMGSMPKSEPGSLTPEETAQLLAYLLKINGLPAGPGDLPTDAATLKAIRFQTAAARPSGPETR